MSRRLAGPEQIVSSVKFSVRLRQSMAGAGARIAPGHSIHLLIRLAATLVFSEDDKKIYEMFLMPHKNEWKFTRLLNKHIRRT